MRVIYGTLSRGITYGILLCLTWSYFRQVVLHDMRRHFPAAVKAASSISEKVLPSQKSYGPLPSAWCSFEQF